MITILNMVQNNTIYSEKQGDVLVTSPYFYVLRNKY